MFSILAKILDRQHLQLLSNPLQPSAGFHVQTMALVCLQTLVSVAASGREEAALLVSCTEVNTKLLVCYSSHFSFLPPPSPSRVLPCMLQWRDVSPTRSLPMPS